MELVRKILLAYEGEEPVDLTGLDEETFWHHLCLMRDGGLLKPFDECDERKWRDQYVGGRGPMAIKLTPTWAGTEFLDATRSPSVREAVNEKLTRVGGAVAFPVFLELLKAEAKRQLGLN